MGRELHELPPGLEVLESAIFLCSSSTLMMVLEHGLGSLATCQNCPSMLWAPSPHQLQPPLPGVPCPMLVLAPALTFLLEQPWCRAP